MGLWFGRRVVGDIVYMRFYRLLHKSKAHIYYFPLVINNDLSSISPHFSRCGIAISKMNHPPQFEPTFSMNKSFEFRRKTYPAKRWGIKTAWSFYYSTLAPHYDNSRTLQYMGCDNVIISTISMYRCYDAMLWVWRGKQHCHLSLIT